MTPKKSPIQPNSHDLEFVADRRHRDDGDGLWAEVGPFRFDFGPSRDDTASLRAATSHRPPGL